jgi:hypothetical protein
LIEKRRMIDTPFTHHGFAQASMPELDQHF